MVLYSITKERKGFTAVGQSRSQAFVMIQAFFINRPLPQCSSSMSILLLRFSALNAVTTIEEGFTRSTFWPIKSSTLYPTPGGAHSHMLVDIKCLSIDPLFLRRSYTQWPPFLFSPHPMTPFFPLLYQILHKNCKFLRASRAFWEI